MIQYHTIAAPFSVRRTRRGESLLTSPTNAVRALIIAPYTGMGTALSQAAVHMPGIELDIRDGDLGDAIALLDQLDQSRYDVIISRGGTAKMLQKITALPVVEVKISVYDMLRVIKLAENYRNQYAIVGYDNITEAAHVLSDLLQKSLQIITLHHQEEVDRVLRQLREKGCRMVICDMVTYHGALSLGLDAYLITSGAESVREALTEAEAQGRRFQSLRARLTTLEAVIASADFVPFVLDRDGKCLYPEAEHQPDERLIDSCARRLPELARPDAGSVSFFHSGKKELQYITGKAIRLDGAEAFVFYRSTGPQPPRSARSGIYSFQSAECEDFLRGKFLGIPGILDDLHTQLRQAAAAGRPAALIGEPGCGQAQAARQLYLNSSYKNRPLVLVDCASLSDRSWDYLFRHPMSPLNRSGITLWIDRADALSQDQAEELFSALYQDAASRRLRLILSFTYERGKRPSASLFQYLSQLSCQTIELPALRSRAEEIPLLATLCLNDLNLEKGRQIIGLDSRAAEQLQQYEWPGNMDQFWQAMQQLAGTASGSYIRSVAVSELLHSYGSFRSLLHPAGTDGIRWKDRTLEEITRDVIHAALENADGNQSKAARVLGISRATMWRALKTPDGTK